MLDSCFTVVILTRILANGTWGLSILKHQLSLQTLSWPTLKHLKLSGDKGTTCKRHWTVFLTSGQDLGLMRQTSSIWTSYLILSTRYYRWCVAELEPRDACTLNDSLQTRQGSLWLVMMTSHTTKVRIWTCGWVKEAPPPRCTSTTRIISCFRVGNETTISNSNNQPLNQPRTETIKITLAI